MIQVLPALGDASSWPQATSGHSITSQTYDVLSGQPPLAFYRSFRRTSRRRMRLRQTQGRDERRSSTKLYGSRSPGAQQRCMNHQHLLGLCTLFTGQLEHGPHNGKSPVADPIGGDAGGGGVLHGETPRPLRHPRADRSCSVRRGGNGGV